MTQVISNPPPEAHIAACGLFCTDCGKLKAGRCKGCQLEAAFAKCPVRICCVDKGITTCAECDEFPSPRDYRECKKLNSFVARIFSLIFGSNRPAGLAVLRDQGQDAYISWVRSGKKRR